jgi:hypothetical protein
VVGAIFLVNPRIPLLLILNRIFHPPVEVGVILGICRDGGVEWEWEWVGVKVWILDLLDLSLSVVLKVAGELIQVGLVCWEFYLLHKTHSAHMVV